MIVINERLALNSKNKSICSCYFMINSLRIRVRILRK